MHFGHRSHQARLAKAGAAALMTLTLALGTPAVALAEEAALPDEGSASIDELTVAEAADAAVAGAAVESEPDVPVMEDASEEQDEAPQAAGEDTPLTEVVEPMGETASGESAPSDDATTVEDAVAKEGCPEATTADAAAQGDDPATTEAVAATDAVAGDVASEETTPARAASGTETPATTPQKPSSDEKAASQPAHEAGLFRVGGKLRYFDGSGASYVRRGHCIVRGVLYDVRGGVATSVNLSGRSFYRCADGCIFFSPSKGSGALATGKRGWVTTSAYGVKDGRYYFRSEQGYRYTTFGFSMAGGSYGVLTGKKGNARTSNYRRGGKVYLIRSNGKMLVLTKAERRRHGYDTCGFTWARRFGDKTCSETFNTKELYFLHRNTSRSAYLSGAYYAVYKKGRLRYEAAGNGLSFTNARGKRDTYEGAHANTSFGFVLRAVNDKRHNVTVKGDMPVVRRNRVYMADANGQLERGVVWSKRQRKAIEVANDVLSKRKGRYAVTVDKTNHYVYLWYCSGRKWLPLCETRCTTGSDRTEVVGDKTLSYVTPKGITKTYDHIKYFAGCTYYATGYRWTRDGGYHIHSTLYNLSSGKRTDSSLGRSASHGCIRVNINYARYVYTLIPLRTQFYVYKNL